MKKTSKKSKGKAKPKAKAKKAPARSQEVVIRVEAPRAVTSIKESDLTPLTTDGGKYAVVPGWIQERQILNLTGKTPAQHIYERPGKGGQKFKYVTGNYVEKVLNFVFRFNWDFEITSHGKEGSQVWVLGKLSVKNDKGNTITKTQFGRADIKMLKTGGMLDYGNDLKAAATDSLKKCASLLGIASDVYGKVEFKQEAGMEVQPDKPALPEGRQEDHSHKEPVIQRGTPADEDFVCLGYKCGNDITRAEAEFSKKMYGKALCRNCQTLAKENKKK